MEAARRMKEVLGAADEVTEVLKALISTGGGVPHLIDASTQKMNEVGVEVLRDKFVLLLISGPKICWRNLYKMRSIYDGIARNDLLEMVWLQEEQDEQDGQEEEEEEDEPRKLASQMPHNELTKLRSQMPRCVLRYFSVVKGIHKITEACGLTSGEIVVLIDPQGDVLSQYRCPPDLWPILPAEKMDRWKGIKEHLQAPGEIMAVLKALISIGDDVLCLSDASTNEMGRPANKRVSIDVLRDKYVLLFISDLNLDCSVIRKMWSIYSGIVNKDLVKLIWIPIVEKWTNEVEKDFERLQSEMQRCILQPLKDVPMVLMMKPSYMEQDVSQAEGLKFIKEWGLEDVPLVLLLNPQGYVLSNHALQLPRIDKEPRGAPDKKEYTLYWGSKYAYWRERLFLAVKAVAQDPIIKEAEISVSLSPVGRDGEPEGLSGSFNWKVQRLFHPFKYENRWALLLSKSFTEICAGPLILNVLEAFHVWKANITEQSPFEFCFKAYYNELSLGFEAFIDEEKEPEDSLDNEMKMVDFADDETGSEDSLDNEMGSEDSLDNDMGSEDFPDNKNGEKMEAARRVKEVLGAPDEVTEVLKALISSGEDVPDLIDASTEQMKQVSIDVLKDKYVLLLISRGMSKSSEFAERGVRFAEGIVKSDLLEIVWLPIVQWDDEMEDKFMELLFKMPLYIVRCFSPIAGKLIEEEWGLGDYPTLVMMNPQGDVLGKHVLTRGCKLVPITPGEKMEKARRLKELFQAPDEVTAVLKALISGNGDLPSLSDCSSGKMKQVSIDVLKEKFVLLVIVRVEIQSRVGGLWLDDPEILQSMYHEILKKEHLEILQSMYHEILKEDLVKVVCIPIVEQWTDELQESFEMLPFGMPYYLVQCVLPVAGLKFIEEEWCLKDDPLLVLMSPQGNLLSKHKMVSEGRIRVRRGAPHEVQDYTFYWRTSNKKWLDWRKSNKTWGEEFSELAEKVARDPIITEKNISIKWRRLKGSRELQRSLNRKARGDWAALEGPDGSLICEGPQILHVLLAFENWKDEVRLNPFGHCFGKRYEELAVNVQASRPR